jgi:hypothetical protein
MPKSPIMYCPSLVCRMFSDVAVVDAALVQVLQPAAHLERHVDECAQCTVICSRLPLSLSFTLPMAPSPMSSEDEVRIHDFLTSELDGF